MRLYLASSKLGNFAEVLVGMVHDNKKALIISNARDHRTAEERKAIVEKESGYLRACGFEVTELDLRNYFGKSDELRSYIDDYAPGLIFSMGGNVYSLATTMRLSGMDEILREDLKNDKYVYGGYSAGSMVTSHDLMNYADSFGKRSDDRLEQTKALYGELSTEGLGLIEEYVVPHADEEKFRDACKEAKDNITSNGLTAVVLKNSDVLVVDGDDKKILKDSMILFSDFDGTFYFHDDESKTNANLEAVRKWRAAGNQFCITTGRSHRSVTEQLPEIKEISDYYIVDSGSIILSETGENIQTFCFNPAIVEKIVEFSKGFSEVPAVFYYTSDSEGAEYKTENLTKLRFWFEDTSLLPSVVKQVMETFPVAAFKQEVGMPSHVALAGRKGFVEIIPIEFGKSNAIKFLQQEKGISSGNIVTVGDGLNDYEMVRDFGGFAIEGSGLAYIHGELKTTNSISALVEKTFINLI